MTASITQEDFNRATETLLGSAKGRLAVAKAAIKFGIATDEQKLAYLFFSDPDFAREVSDKVWAASQQRAATS